MTPEQYETIKPYYKYIANEQCGDPAICAQLANMHEAFGWGPINRTCSGCITQMMKTFNAHRIEYESRKQGE